MRNPLASPAGNGIMDASPPMCLDQSFNYIYPVSLTALQQLNFQTVSILTSADFLLRGLLFSTTGTFSLRLYDGNQYALSSDLIVSANLLGVAGDPNPIFPEIFYPAGGRITLDIEDTSDATNTGQIIFIGASRYHLS